jgi:pyruvate kinase
MRRTRIITTLGPASESEATIAELLAAGVDVFRLNFSHGSVATHAETCRRIRQAAAASGRSVSVLQDLGGPKIRTGPVAKPFLLTEGDSLAIELGDFAGGPGRVSCSFDALFTSVQAGQRLLVNDGRIELQVTAVSPGRLTTSVVTGGMLDAHKGINVPNVPLRTSALTPKDADDLRAGIAMGVDLVALSFVQTAEDLKTARALTVSAGAPDLPLIAKIEKPLAVEHLEEIIAVADGLMVARGDLGIEMPFETLPSVQKRIILAARRRGVPVIVATQVLESMVTEPMPTRAEVTDAAHAVDEGADAIMLSDETAVGRYPVRAVSALDAIIREAEKMLEPAVLAAPERAAGVVADVAGEHGRALCDAAVTLAQSARATAIVAVTEAGKTARLLAALRPAATILAATPNSQTASRLSLVWGVTPVVTDATDLRAVREALLANGLVSAGAVVVFVAMHPMLGRDGTNFVHVERV